ncbi:MAG: hypothetical protein IJE05_07240 [Clostridia bacterium]|nr:hypothetical protein [Clostridia bacterium]
MQVSEDLTVFVKTDLLLHEKEFNALLDFIKNLEQSDLRNDDCIDYSAEEGCITVTSLMTGNQKTTTPKLILASVYPKERIDALASGYILLTIGSLKKLLSM